MSIRIEDPNIGHTETLLLQVLSPIIKDNERVRFLCDAGTGADVLQRMRTMLSRKRRDAEARGKKPRRFKLRASIHPETHNGKRFDCVVCWKAVEPFHYLREELEDILNG